MRQILRFSQVIQKVGLARATINRNEPLGQFPRRIQIGKNAVGWWDDEIDAWLESRRIVRNSVSP